MNSIDELAESNSVDKIDKNLVESIDALNVPDDEKDLYLRIFNDFYPGERDFCLKLLKASGDNPTVQDRLLIYPGAYDDIEHALLTRTKNGLFIDPAYVPHLDPEYEGIGLVERIATKLESYDIKHIGFSRDKDNIHKAQIFFEIGKEQRSIMLRPADAIKYLSFSDVLDQGIGSFFLKDPNTLRDSGMTSLYELSRNQCREKIVNAIIPGGLYLEAGLKHPVIEGQGLGLRKIGEGFIGCKGFWRDRADESLYYGTVWQKMG